MTDKSKLVVGRNVVLGDTEIRIIDALSDKLGLGPRGFSAALRIIVREWIELSAREYALHYSQPNPLVSVADAQKAAGQL